MENSQRLQHYLYDGPYIKMHIKDKSTMILENIPEGYTPLSNIIKKNDIEFSFNQVSLSHYYCGVSTYKDDSDIYVLCVKNEHIEKLKNYFAELGMSGGRSDEGLLEEINAIPDMFHSFKVEYGFRPEKLKNDPILVKQIVDSYTSDRIKQLLKNKLFGTHIEGEWPTFEPIIATEPDNVIDNLPF
jgi:hypothetical protein